MTKLAPLTLGSAERDLLIACVAQLDDLPIEWPVDIGAEAVLAAARAYAVAPTLGARDFGGSAPGWVEEELREVSAATAAKNAALLADLHAAVEALRQVGVDTIALKGAALLIRGVVQPHARHLDDVDILIRRSDRGRALATLLEAGFRVDPRFERPGVDGRPLHTNWRSDAHSEVGIVGPTGCLIDLHIALPSSRRRDDFKRLRARAREVETRGGAVLIPEDSDLIAMLCDHVMVHHEARPRYLPRHLADLRALLSSDAVDVSAFLAAGRSAAIGSVAASVLLLAAANRAVPPTIARGALAPVFPPQWVSRTHDRAADLYEAWQRLRADVRSPIVVARKLFPARAYLAERYALPADEITARHWMHRLVTFRWLTHEQRG